MRSAVFGLLLGSLCLVACDDDTDNGVVVHLPRPTPFILQLVNNRALPVIIVDPTTVVDPTIIVDPISPQFGLEVVFGAFSINVDGTFSLVTRLQDTRGLVIVIRDVTCFGTFTNVGNTFTFVSAFGSFGSLDCPQVFTGVVTVDVLTTTLRGFPAVFSRLTAVGGSVRGTL